MKIYYDGDADLAFIRNRTVAILGYGSQGHAQAQNLRESGVSVIIGLRQGGRSWSKAVEDGFEVMSVAEATQKAGVVHLLLPDEQQGKVYKEEIAPHLREGMAIGFSHGFNIHFNQIVPPKNVDVFMVAPKGPGHLVRRTFVEGGGVPALIAIAQDASGRTQELALAFARGIGGTRAGVIETSFREETETDLFGEQTVLCGGLVSLVKAGYETLTEAGYAPEMAYFECMHELKLIVDLMYEGGISWMNHSISDTAQYGEMTVGPKLITTETKETMKSVLAAIQNGEFARSWILENQANRPVFNALANQEEVHSIEQVGRRLRSMMPWLNPKEAPARR